MTKPSYTNETISPYREYEREKLCDLLKYRSDVVRLLNEHWKKLDFDYTSDSPTFVDDLNNYKLHKTNDFIAWKINRLRLTNDKFRYKIVPEDLEYRG